MSQRSREIHSDVFERGPSIVEDVLLLSIEVAVEVGVSVRSL